MSHCFQVLQMNNQFWSLIVGFCSLEGQSSSSVALSSVGTSSPELIFANPSHSNPSPNNSSLSDHQVPLLSCSNSSAASLSPSLSSASSASSAVCFYYSVFLPIPHLPAQIAGCSYRGRASEGCTRTWFVRFRHLSPRLLATLSLLSSAALMALTLESFSDIHRHHSSWTSKTS